MAFLAAFRDNKRMSDPQTKSAVSSPAVTNQANWRSVTLSLIFHVLVLVLLVIFVTNPQSGADGEALRRVDVVLTEVSESQSEFEYQTESDVTNSSQPPQIDALPTEQPPPTLPEVAAPELPGFEVDPQMELDASQMTQTPANSRLDEKYELSADDLKFIAREQALVRQRAPKGSPVATKIFGSAELVGRRFVFVIDRSKSMGESGLGVIGKARGELKTALDELKPEHLFQVIAYHQSTVMIGERQMLTATEENKRRVPGFIQNLAAFGATRHENGLTAALSFRPDVVVLMTDGGLPSLNQGQIDALLKMAGRTTEIHTLQFGIGVNQERDNFMMRLANQTGGSYRYINVSNWDE